MATFRDTFLSKLEEGTSIKESARGAARTTIKQLRKDYSKQGLKERAVRGLFGGDSIAEAYIRGKLGVKKKKKGDKEPSAMGSGEEGSGVSAEGITFIKIIAKNSMAIPGMARDMNVLRQNVQKLVKLKGGKAKGRADAFFLKEDERERALEAQRAKVQTAPGQPQPTPEKGEGGILDSIMSMFSGGFTSAIKNIFSPKMLGSILKKVFLPVAIIGTLFSGIMDGWKRYQETGNFGDAIVAGLGGMLNFLTFGLFGEDTLKSLWSSVSDFLSPITDTIGEIFTGIKNFFVKLFGGKVEDKSSGKIDKTTPNMPDPKQFAVQAAKAGGADEQKAQDLGGIFDSAGKGDMESMFKKAQDFATKYPEPAPSETSPTPAGQGIPADQAQRNYELNKQLTGEASKALGVQLPMPASPSPAATAPTTPAPTPAPEMSDEDKIKQLEGYIEGNKKRMARREADADRHIKSFAKRHTPEETEQLKKDYAEAISTEKKEVEDANAGFQRQIDVLKKSGSPSASTSSQSAPAPSTTPTESGSSSGTPSLDASGGPAVSGSEVSSESTQVSEGQRMESAADQGSVINAPTTNNSTAGQDNYKPPAASPYNFDFTKMLRTT